MQKDIYDTIIIGSGPAGLTAAIYNVRANLKTIVIGGGYPGGQLTITSLVENFPGFANGISGPKLMMDMMQQVKNLGVEIKTAEVIRVEKSQNGFTVELKDGTKTNGKAVIVATGARAKWLGIPGEQQFLGKGVSGCATCDGMFFKDKTVAVVGGGDTACSEAHFLTKFVSKIIIIHRRDEFRAGKTEQKRVIDNTKIEILWNTEALEVGGKEKVEWMKVKNNKTGEIKNIKIDGFFVAVGHNPATEFVKGLVDLRETGQIIVKGGNDYGSMSSVEGIFAAGDCVDDRYRQAIIAAGMGAMAALDAEKWIESDK